MAFATADCRYFAASRRGDPREFFGQWIQQAYPFTTLTLGDQALGKIRTALSWTDSLITAWVC